VSTFFLTAAGMLLFLPMRDRKQPVETEPNDSSDDREIMNHRLRIEARMSGEPSDG
jgi:hypothetical protein